MRSCIQWTRLAVALLMPLALVLAVETVARLSLAEALQWITLTESINTLRFTYLWLVFCGLLLYALTNRLRWAAGLCFAVISAVAVLHAGKQVLLQQPLTPQDFAFFGMSSSIWSFSYFPFTWGQAAAFAAIVALWSAACHWGLPDWRLDRKRRLLVFVTAVALVAALSANVSLFASREVPIYRKLTVVWRAENNQASAESVAPGIQNPDFSTSFNYLSFGMIPGFLLNFDQKALDAEAMPPGYSAAAVRRAWGNLPPGPVDEPAPKPIDDAERPHVVIVLSESFWDPCWLDDVEIDPDPLPSFRRLAAGPQAREFIAVSPIFGGYTCKAEYELLTGLSIAALPRRTVPHTRHFNSHVPALPAVFKANGYQTVAVHPFLADFWNRNLVFPAMGFDRFIHIETMRHREVKGKFISDSALADEVIDLLDAATEPTFLFAVTMQNHSPYGDQRYGPVEVDSVRIRKSTVSAETVRDYVHGVRDADAMLDKLTRHFENYRRPVLLVFTGDHQPNLIPREAEPGLFTQALRPDAGSPRMTLGRKFSGPALVWSNREQPPVLPSPLSLAALPSWVLRQAGLPLPPFFLLSEQVFQRFPVLHRNWGLTADGELRALSLPFTDPLLRDYQLVCHDLLLGKDYSRQFLADADARLRRRRAE